MDMRNLTPNMVKRMYDKLATNKVKCYRSHGDAKGHGIPYTSSVFIYGKQDDVFDLIELIVHETVHTDGKRGHSNPDNPIQWAAWAVSSPVYIPPEDYDPFTWFLK